jgi:AcrR family transcriptional regulator
MARRSDHTREELLELALDAAAALAERYGLAGVTARGVARHIGYTVGTLYNVFGNLDDLVRQVNGRTLDALYEALAADGAEAAPDQALRRLAARYIDFVKRHPRRWAAVLEYEPQSPTEAPDWYRAKTARIFALAEQAIAGFLGPDDVQAGRRHAHILWSALYGMHTVEQTGGLPNGDTLTDLVGTLIDTYVAGLRR